MFTAPPSELEARMQSRQKAFMQVPDFTELKKRRDEHDAELRRTKRTEAASKRRNLAPSSSLPSDPTPAATFTLADLPSLRTAVERGSDSDFLFAATAVRKMLSIKIDPPIQDVIDAGMVPVLMEWLKREDLPLLQYEACWALTNVSSGAHEHAAALVNKGVIPQLYELLKSKNQDVCEQAVWLLGNICGDSPELRNAVLQSGGLSLLLEVLTHSPTPSLLRTTAWAVSNACRGSPAPQSALVAPAIPFLAEVVKTQNDPESIKDCLWAISSMCDGKPDLVQLLLNTSILPCLVTLSCHSSSKIQLPALRCIGNAVSGPEEQTQLVIDAGFVPQIKELLKSEKASIRKESAWILSNLAAGSVAQIQTLVYTGVFQVLLSTILREPTDVQKEMLYTLQNASLASVDEVPMHLIQINTIGVIGELLDSKNSRIVHLTLEVFRCLLEAGKRLFLHIGSNHVCTLIEGHGYLHKIELLQQHDNRQIYKRALSIITTFFDTEQPTDELTASILAVPHFEF